MYARTPPSRLPSPPLISPSHALSRLRLALSLCLSPSMRHARSLSFSLHFSFPFFFSPLPLEPPQVAEPFRPPKVRKSVSQALRPQGSEKPKKSLSESTKGHFDSFLVFLTQSFWHLGRRPWETLTFWGFRARRVRMAL